MEERREIVWRKVVRVRSECGERVREGVWKEKVRLCEEGERGVKREKGVGGE